MKRFFKIGFTACLVMVSLGSQSGAALITYDVNLRFDPNSTPTTTLGPNGPGTVTGTMTIDTSIPIFNQNLVTQPANEQPTNVVSVNLLEKSNNGTILSGFSNSTSQLFNAVAPYTITFLFAPVIEYPATATVSTHNNGVQYERVSFSSPPVIDSIQLGPNINFDFPLPTGGSVIPGNFDSQASTGFDSYLYGTVTASPNAVPEPSSVALFGIGAVILLIGAYRRQKWVDS